MMLPSASRLSRPLPPVIRTTLARALCAGLSRRTGGVLTTNVVSMVTASASTARAADETPQTANAKHALKIRVDRLNGVADWKDMCRSPCTSSCAPPLRHEVVVHMNQPEPPHILRS